MKRSAALAIAAALTFGCDAAPEHYYVMCEYKDGNGWNLIDAEYDENGYLIACTYQSPDRTQSYEARCREDGCD